MKLPNYTDGSIVNLMSSVGKSFGCKSEYKELKILSSRELRQSKNVVLIILDGLGYQYLKEKGKNTTLAHGLKGKITSVFPATTASAITTFITGTAPQQHAVTGWFMHLKELGVVSTILRFNPRVGGPPFTNYNIKVEEILSIKSFLEKIKVSSYWITYKKIKDSDFTKAISKKSKILGYSTLDEFFIQIKKVIKSHNRRKYIYAYWPKFDSISHDYGINGKKTERHFWYLDTKIRQLVKNIKGTDTTIIITADHGLINTTKKKTIMLEDHPTLKECLTLPFCGDPRLVYCYVHPSKTKQFEKYVKNNLNKFCDFYKSEELVRKNYFGLFKPNPKLMDRIGDYVLIMKENYIFEDNVLNQKEDSHIGNHGGISSNEMFVPLIVFRV